MTNRHATVDHPINELLVRRHSPYSFDPDRGVAENDVAALFEAARWTMSSYNTQPWRYVVASKERQPETWKKSTTRCSRATSPGPPMPPCWPSERFAEALNTTASPTRLPLTTWARRQPC